MTIAEDNLSLHTWGRSSTAPTDDGNYSDSIKKGLAFLAQRRYIDTSSLADINYFPPNTNEYVKMPSQDRPINVILRRMRRWSIPSRLMFRGGLGMRDLPIMIGGGVLGMISGEVLSVHPIVQWVLIGGGIAFGFLISALEWIDLPVSEK
jgi:hypothetical protein